MAKPMDPRTAEVIDDLAWHLHQSTVRFAAALLLAERGCNGASIEAEDLVNGVLEDVESPFRITRKP